MTKTQQQKQQRMVKAYLKYIGTNYPNFEDFQIWWMEKKTSIVQPKDWGDYRGVINLYSKRYLNNKIGQGARNSGNYLQLLRSLEDIQTNTVEVDPVQIVMDIKTGKKGTHARSKVKQPIG